MEEKYNKTQAFCYELFDISQLDNESFQDLYWYYFRDCSRPLMDEIIANVSTLDSKQFAAYSKHVDNEIRDAFPDNPDVTYADKWAKDLNLNLEDFPFFDNPEIDHYTSKVWSNYEKGKKSKKAQSIQMDFFRYASLLEARKILMLLNELSPDPKSKTLDHNIFIPQTGHKLFTKLIDFLNIKDHTTRGNQAKINAIWQTDESRKAIFKTSTEKRHYLNYINSIFGSNFNTDSMSDGRNHEPIIINWIKQQES